MKKLSFVFNSHRNDMTKRFFCVSLLKEKVDWRRVSSIQARYYHTQTHNAMKKSESDESEDMIADTVKEEEEKRDESLLFVSELWKRSDFIRRWNLRYFELYRDGMLRFFQDKPSRRLRGVFLLNLKGNRVCREDSSDPRVITTASGKNGTNTLHLREI